MYMTNADKVEKVKLLLDKDENATTDIVMVYLDLARQKILERIYPFEVPEEKPVPNQYAMLHVELAVRLYLRRGGEGETSHEENGVNRVYDSTNDEDILSRLVPFAKVM